jgi:ribosome-binding protein aMBF1 (putative translation factor)
VACLLEDMGLSTKELADALETTPRTLERCRSGEAHQRAGRVRSPNHR